MKRTFTVIILLILTGIECKAQNEVLFKIKMLPNHTYSSAMRMITNMEMTMTGDSTFMEKVRISGQKFPMIILMQNGVNTNITTLPVNTKKEIPFVAKMQSTPSKMTVNGIDAAMPMPETNQVFYGAYLDEGKSRIDSISGKTLDETTKAAIIKMMDGLQANIKFPQKPMKIGDTFYQDVPMELPIAGMTLKAVSKTTYKLFSIQNGKANFDIKYTIAMDKNNSQQTMSMEGGGDGKFAFDLATHYPVTVLNSMDLTYSMQMPQDKNVTMSGKLKMVTNNQTDIKAAP